ncbi:MAG: type II secretion system protein [Verrucomicrobiota bacterium JB024]|nr:type II secretion system protein [Verrucomicrobiota bacterium JB024]
MPRIPRPVRPAFSLIELLSVIAVIAVLTAIIIPAVGKVRAMSMQTKTSASLRQTGMAILAYANDHQGKMPGPATWAVFPWYVNPTTYTTQAHLNNYLFPYYNLPPATNRTLSDVLSCPALSEAAQTDTHTAQYVRSNGPASLAAEDRPWGGNTNAEAGTPFLQMGWAAQSPNQPPRLSELSEKAYRVGILCTADQKSWVSADSGRLPADGAFDGKRIFLFLDGSLSEPTTALTLAR